MIKKRYDFSTTWGEVLAEPDGSIDWSRYPNLLVGPGICLNFTGNEFRRIRNFNFSDVVTFDLLPRDMSSTND